MQTEGGASPKNCFSRKWQDALGKMKKSFLCVPGVGRVVLQELRFSQGGLVKPVLVDSTETCTSGLSREVY